jgi:hypothetical protein
MDFSALKAVLADPRSVRQRSFAILREISRHVNRQTTHNEGRELVIRALAVLDGFSEEEQEILFSLVRSAGLFPYMSERLDASDFDDYVAYELHRADNMGGELVFHSLQAKIYYQLMTGANVVLSALTSVGKSLIVDALFASGKYQKIVIVVPTIALIDETRRRLLSRFKSRCAVITHPTQQARSGRINVYVLTQERVLQREDLDDIDIFIVDEFYKVNLSGETELDRPVDLNLAFHKLARTGAQFYMLGPNIQAIKGLESYEYHFIASEFSTVAVDVVNLNLPARGDERISKLLELCRTVDGPTIIYCQSPRSASEVSMFLAAKMSLPVSEATTEAVAWISTRYHPDWAVCHALRYGFGVHHGGVPRALQQYFIRLFNSRRIPLLVCTSTIIEGVNTVARNVIVYDRRKSKNILDHFTYKNIEGRAGRMREYFIGKVYVLESRPPDESYSVEFPIGLQQQETPLSLLLALDEGDLAPASRGRLEELFRESTLSPETLRQNRHTPVVLQERIAAIIRAGAAQYDDALVWSGHPRAPQLQAVCDLIFDHLESTFLPNYAVHSGSALAWHLNALRMAPDLTTYVKRCITSRNSNDSPSDAVETALKFLRNVVCHRFPRDLMVVDAIQREIFSKLGREAGDYSVFAEQAESLFMPSVLFALDEYGGFPWRLRNVLRPGCRHRRHWTTYWSAFESCRCIRLILIPLRWTFSWMCNGRLVSSASVSSRSELASHAR